MKRKSTEKETQRAVLDYLIAKRVFHWRNNTGAMKTASGGFIRFGALGSPDIFAIHAGKVYGLEVKDVHGRLSDDQEAFGRGLVKAGGSYHVLRSIDDAIALFP